MQKVTLENETKVGLLYALKDFTRETVKGLILPVKRQKQDQREPSPRPAAVFLARLPDMMSFDKKAPFILHQAVTGEDGLKNANQRSGRESRPELQSSAVIRSVFCVYHPDEQEGGLTLLNIMEEMRIALLMRPILSGVFELNLKDRPDGLSGDGRAGDSAVLPGGDGNRLEAAAGDENRCGAGSARLDAGG